MTTDTPQEAVGDDLTALQGQGEVDGPSDDVEALRGASRWCFSSTPCRSTNWASSSQLCPMCPMTRTGPISMKPSAHGDKSAEVSK